MASVPDNRPSAPAFEVKPRDAGATVVLSGSWTLQDLGPRLRSLRKALVALAKRQGLHWDLRAVDRLDSAAAVVLWQIWRGRRPQSLSLRPEHDRMLQRVAAEPARAARPRRHPVTALVDVLAWLGSGIHEHLRGALSLPGEITLDLLYILRHPGEIPWREISASIHSAGFRALMITGFVGILIGVVVSYLSAIELQLYGADTYIVDILGISVVRELGPLLAAILVAGRSGSSMTAHLGVMRMDQELDAMAAIGISPTRRLVLPRVVGLAVAMPLIVLWTSAAALLGGMISANHELGISFGQFVAALPDALPMANYWIAVGKGVLFGILIALTACYFGLRIRPNSESLGRETTNSVVAGITVTLIADAVLAIVLQGVGYP
ncbi:MAG TPA: ABC transporter permease [Gammaproteobacteria bacterium]|nr:ABC transporter permease [Gammaproteobacteria bacterium]